MNIGNLIAFIKNGPILKESFLKALAEKNNWDQFESWNGWRPPGILTEPWGPPSTALDDLGDKAAARILLADRIGGLVVPTAEQWYGLSKLERDDEL